MRAVSSVGSSPPKACVEPTHSTRSKGADAANALASAVRKATRPSRPVALAASRAAGSLHAAPRRP